ncbi:MAG: hypothetical protein Q9214_006212, partial [Letrouitia sp. 1 TL-2023]
SLAAGTCADDEGLASSTYTIDFTHVNTQPSEWKLADNSKVTFGADGAELTFAKRYDAPTMWTSFKFFFGRVEFVVKAAPGVGIVSSMVLLSQDLDEIDWEFLGGQTSTVQTNYFGKGYTGTYNRSTTPAVTNPQEVFHNYALDWSPDALIWFIDGKAVRTLKAAEADGNGDQYPQSPMKVSLSLWDAGDPDAATKDWAGGITPIPPPQPYTMFVRSVKIWNRNPGNFYRYTDRSGSWKSIKVLNDSSASSTLALVPTSSQPQITFSSDADIVGGGKGSSTIATTALTTEKTSSFGSATSRGKSTGTSGTSGTQTAATVSTSNSHVVLSTASTNSIVGSLSTSSICASTTVSATTMSLGSPRPTSRTLSSTLSTAPLFLDEPNDSDDHDPAKSAPNSSAVGTPPPLAGTLSPPSSNPSMDSLSEDKSSSSDDQPSSAGLAESQFKGAPSSVTPAPRPSTSRSDSSPPSSNAAPQDSTAEAVAGTASEKGLFGDEAETNGGGKAAGGNAKPESGDTAESDEKKPEGHGSPDVDNTTKSDGKGQAAGGDALPTTSEPPSPGDDKNDYPSATTGDDSGPSSPADADPEESTYPPLVPEGSSPFPTTSVPENAGDSAPSSIPDDAEVEEEKDTVKQGEGGDGASQKADSKSG